MNRRRVISQRLDRGVFPVWRKLDSRERDAATADFLAWTGARLPAREDDPAAWDEVELARFLRDRLALLVDRHAQLTHAFRTYQQRLELAESVEVRHALMLEFLKLLGAARRGDRAAFSRWLDVDAVAERYDRERAGIERRLRFCLDRLGPLAREVCLRQPPAAGTAAWGMLDLEKSLVPLLGFPGDGRIRESALACLRNAVGALGDGARQRLARSTVQYVFRTVLDTRNSVWLQCEALETLARIAPEELQGVADQRLAGHGDSHADAMFFRRRLAETLVASLSLHPGVADTIRRLAGDPAPFVRAGVAELTSQLPPHFALELWKQLVNDPVPAVAGAALLQAPKMITEPAIGAEVAAWMPAALASERDMFPLRVAIHIAPALLSRVRLHSASEADALRDALEVALTQLHTGHPATAIRRHAATARELLASVDQASNLAALPLHARRKLPAPADPIAFARSLLPLVQHGFGFNLSITRGRLVLLRDWLWRPRLWRVIHEARRPATDKRQNYPHARGRIYPGLLHLPSACVAELSPTKVPGEPLHIAEEDGWRPWLPLLDQVLSALDQDGPIQPLRIVTVEGVTTVHVPDRLSPRLRAKWRLTRDFAHVASLRNWTTDSPFPPHAFVDALRACGIDCGFVPHAARDGRAWPEDPRVRRFFRAAVLALPARLSDLTDYFYSIYQNNLSQLLVFVGALGAWFFGHHAWLNRTLRRARARLPLVMGGWGTRGKSGTERLKAAVMSALGLRVLSKTTGCEAMFLFGQPNRPLSEMFLFRPYDKATIWEQARLTRMAAALDTDVMLWECMGLNPGYVRVLQHDWMRDDVSTITNCFPDHEDIQGPAGVDLPLVIREFIPPRGELYTSEENMLPFLAERAAALGTSLASTNWLDVGLLTPDVLARFPYQEHPANIALVARMCEGMGLRRDFALKEMADRVVPDLGVLKTYPEAVFEGRRIVFINGMSANERHGCLSNWVRTRMDAHRLDTDPGTWTVTVVNNRADRVARSEVFADILVNDIGADRHYLIGGNLDGLGRFIRESFDVFVSSLEGTGTGSVATLLESVLRRWRVPLDASESDARMQACLRTLGVDVDIGGVDAVLEQLPTAQADALRAQRELHREDVARVDALRKAMSVGTDAAAQVRELLWGLFSARIVPVPDYFVPGNVLVMRMLRDAPPGSRIRAMGIQNIKGTGLDFIYRWQAWEIQAAQCSVLRGQDAEAALAAAQALAASTDLGVLEVETLRATIADTLSSRIGHSDLMRSLLSRIERNLEASMAEIEAYSGPRTGGDSPLRSWFTRSVERVLDAGDAVRRRRHADLVYTDLVAGRISSARAAYELKRLTQRQKGGWLGT